MTLPAARLPKLLRITFDRAFDMRDAPDNPRKSAGEMMLRRLIVWFVLTALLGVQGLAAIHGVAHNPVLAWGDHATQGSTAASGERFQDAGQDLFGDHETESDCRLFDQLASADAVFMAAVFSMVPPSVAVPPVHVGSNRCLPSPASFSPRAPPSTR